MYIYITVERSPGQGNSNSPRQGGADLFVQNFQPAPTFIFRGASSATAHNSIPYWRKKRRLSVDDGDDDDDGEGVYSAQVWQYGNS